MTRPRIVIVVEGGQVQGVNTDGVELDVLVLDYDTEGADESDIVDIPQQERDDYSRTEKATFHFEVVYNVPTLVDKIYAAVEAHEAASLAEGSDPS